MAHAAAAPSIIFGLGRESLSAFAFVLAVAGIYSLLFAFTRRRRIGWAMSAIVCFSGAFVFVWSIGPAKSDGPNGVPVQSQGPQHGTGAHS